MLKGVTVRITDYEYKIELRFDIHTQSAHIEISGTDHALLLLTVNRR